jgi:hypothetical protein
MGKIMVLAGVLGLAGAIFLRVLYGPVPINGVLGLGGPLLAVVGYVLARVFPNPEIWRYGRVLPARVLSPAFIEGGELLGVVAAVVPGGGLMVGGASGPSGPPDEFGGSLISGSAHVEFVLDGLSRLAGVSPVGDVGKWRRGDFVWVLIHFGVHSLHTHAPKRYRKPVPPEVTALLVAKLRSSPTAY